MNYDFPDEIQDYVEDFDEIKAFEVDEYVNVQALGHHLGSEGDNYELFDDVEGDAAFYKFPESTSGEGVLYFTEGNGWCCADNEENLVDVRDWFQEELEDFRSTGWHLGIPSDQEF